MKLHECTGITLATSTKRDGNLSICWGTKTTVTRNREIFLAKLDVRPENCVIMEVEHKDAVVVVDHKHTSVDPTAFVTADAFITVTKNIALFLLTADCVPIALYDPISKAIALAHCGRRSTDRGLAKKVVQQLVAECNADPTRVVVHIGPCIHKESYTLKKFEQEGASEWKPYVETLASGDVCVDLVAFNRAQLLEVGICPENISIDPKDTGVSDDYFSHYRSIRTGEPEGRFATVIVLQ